MAACDKASKICMDSRERGTMIGEFGNLMGTIAKSLDERLVSIDADFKSIRGLEVIAR